MNSSAKPVVWITRKLTDKTMARAAQNYEVIDNPQDRTFTGDEFIELSRNVDAILPSHSEIIDARVTAALSDRVKIIANHSVGTDHCDLKALGERGIVVTNTPDVLSDATAEIGMLLMLGAARRAVEGDRMVRTGQLDLLEPLLHGRDAGLRETHWHYRHGPCWTVHGKILPWF